MVHSRACLLLLSLLAIAGNFSCSTSPVGDEPGEPESPRHILLITLDALRADHLGCYGYPRPTSPSIDRLAGGGTLYSAAQVPRGQTWPALSSLLTGRYPLQHGVRSNSMRLNTRLTLLPQALHETGYRTAAFLSNYGDAIDSGESFGLDHLVRADVTGVAPHEQWDEKMTDGAVQWITEHRDQSVFTWVHLMNPHRPYAPPALERDLLVGDHYQGWLADGITVAELNQGIRNGSIPLTGEQLDEFVHARYWKPWQAGTYLDLLQQQDWTLTFDQLLDLVVLQRVALSPADLAYIHARYDAEILTADRCVDRLLDTISRLGLREQTLVILASDHGDELFDHNHYLFHSASISQGVLHVPLIIRWPGQIAPAVVEGSLAEITDLLPTILEAAGSPMPPGLPGRSLLGRVEAGSPPPLDALAFAEINHSQPAGAGAEPPLDAVYSVRDSRWKLVLNLSGRHPRHVPYICLPDRGYPIPREALYDLKHDPREQHNLLALKHPRLEEVALVVGEGERLNAAEYLLEANLAAAKLSIELDQWLDGQQITANSMPASPVSEEVRQRLAALGYLEAEALSPVSSSPTAGAAGREGLIRAALQLSMQTPDTGKTDTAARTRRAQSLTDRALARLGDLQLASPLTD